VPLPLSIDAWMGAAGFGNLQTEDLWLIHGRLAALNPYQLKITSDVSSARGDVQPYAPTDDLEGLEAPAFGTSA